MTFGVNLIREFGSLPSGFCTFQLRAIFEGKSYDGN